MSKCRHIEKNLLDIIEQAASGKLSPDVSEHLQSCPECNSMVEMYQHIFAQSPQEQIEPPDTLWRNLQQQINAIEQQQSGFFDRLHLPRVVVLSLHSATLVAAAVAGVCLGSGIGNPDTAFADELVSGYSSLLTETAATPLAESYLEFEINNGEETP